MERDLGTMQVDAALKANSHVNAILQEFKSMRHEMKMEFAKVQKNMDDMASKILAETKKVETINNASPIEETSQPLDVEPANGICIEQVYSEEAPVLSLIEIVKEESLLSNSPPSVSLFQDNHSVRNENNDSLHGSAGVYKEIH
ncbi:unnamed protein product [Clavelina lepadiformis]|uniref:Uncharacterized protein n=1 Tax=Clavelina lepadiformis TaxID=159417 RepID=A0ABP0GL91_CLALP